MYQFFFFTFFTIYFSQKRVVLNQLFHFILLRKPLERLSIQRRYFKIDTDIMPDCTS